MTPWYTAGRSRAPDIMDPQAIIARAIERAHTYGEDNKNLPQQSRQSDPSLHAATILLKLATPIDMDRIRDIITATGHGLNLDLELTTYRDKIEKARLARGAAARKKQRDIAAWTPQYANLLAAKSFLEAVRGVRNATYGGNMIFEDWVDSDAVDRLDDWRDEVRQREHVEGLSSNMSGQPAEAAAQKRIQGETSPSSMPHPEGVKEREKVTRSVLHLIKAHPLQGSDVERSYGTSTTRAFEIVGPYLDSTTNAKKYETTMPGFDAWLADKMQRESADHANEAATNKKLRADWKTAQYGHEMWGGPSSSGNIGLEQTAHQSISQNRMDSMLQSFRETERENEKRIKEQRQMSRRIGAKAAKLATSANTTGYEAGSARSSTGRLRPQKSMDEACAQQQQHITRAASTESPTDGIKDTATEGSGIIASGVVGSRPDVCRDIDMVGPNPELDRTKLTATAMSQHSSLASTATMERNESRLPTTEKGGFVLTGTADVPTGRASILHENSTCHVMSSRERISSRARLTKFMPKQSMGQRGWEVRPASTIDTDTALGGAVLPLTQPTNASRRTHRVSVFQEGRVTSLSSPTNVSSVLENQDQLSQANVSGAISHRFPTSPGKKRKHGATMTDVLTVDTDASKRPRVILENTSKKLLLMLKNSRDRTTDENDPDGTAADGKFSSSNSSDRE